MNALEKSFRKNPIQKIEKKNSKSRSEIAACERKNTSEKANFGFLASYSRLKKNSHRKEHSFFRSTTNSTTLV